MTHALRALGWSSRLAAVIALAAITLMVPGSVAQTPVSEADTAEEANPPTSTAARAPSSGTW